MALVGPRFSGVMVMIAVAGFCAVVLWWPKWSGPGTRALVARCGVLLVVNSSAADCCGADEQRLRVLRRLERPGRSGRCGCLDHARGGDAGAAIKQSVAPDRPPAPVRRVPIGSLPPLPSAMGVNHPVHTYTITGARSGIRARVVMELPASYFEALIAAARPPPAVQSTVLAHAGHRFSLWQGLLPQALTWLGHTVPGFAFSAAR